VISDAMRQACHAVFREARPVLLAGWFEPYAQNRCFYREVLLTPLGPAGGGVDHVLSAGAFGRDEPVRNALARFFGAPTENTGEPDPGMAMADPGVSAIRLSTGGPD
jgi:hypothetical protein